MAKRVIAFLRVSTEHQDLVQQRDAVMRAIIADGFERDDVIIIEGKESAIKLSEEQRVTLQQLKTAIDETQTITDVYVFAIDRLARRVSVVLSVKDFLTERGVNLTFLNPHKMSTLRKGDDGRVVEDELTSMILMFLSYGAQMEMKLKAQRFAAAKDLMKKQGKVYNGRVRFGYKLDENKKPVEDPETANIVREIMSLVAGGLSCRSAYKVFVNKGIFQPKRKGTEVMFVHGLVNDLRYSKGDGSYPPILDELTQNKAIANVLDGKSKPKTDIKHTYMCKGVIKWQGKWSMTGKSGHHHYRYDEDYTHKSHTVSIEIADGICWMFTRHHYLLDTAAHSKERIEVSRAKIADNKTTIERLHAEIEKGEKRLSKAFEKYVLGTVADASYEAITRQINGVIEGAKKQIATLETENAFLERSLESTESIDIGSTWQQLDALPLETKIEIVKKTVKSIAVDKEGEVFSFTVNGIYGATETYYYRQWGRKHEVWYISRNGERRLLPL